MIRLLLGFVAAIGLLYGGLHYMGRRAQMSGTHPGVPAQGRQIEQDFKRIEAQNRAVLEKTVRTADESH
jgi:hypothetical protein